MLRLLRVGAILVLTGLLVLRAQPAVPAAAATPELPSLQTVRSVYNDLLDLYFKPLDPAALLRGAWQGLTAAQARTGKPLPAALPALPAEREPAFAAFASAFDAYTGSLPAEDAASVPEQIADAMASSLHEAHTTYLPRSLFQALAGGRRGTKPTGAGLRLISSQLALTVTEVAADGPAAQAGVLPGDVIDGINGKSLFRASREELNYAFGEAPAGWITRYSVLRQGQHRDIAVVSGPYYFPPLSSRVLDDDIGYLRLTTFAEPFTTQPDGTQLIPELDRQLDGLDAQGVRALILDLRGNGGGSVETADELLGRFLPEDTLTSRLSDAYGHTAETAASGQMRAVQLPLVVLVDSDSASAAEIVAATLAENHRAVLVGERTAGALAAAEILPLPGGGGLEVAQARDVTGRLGTVIDGSGVPVSVTARDTRTAADFANGRDAQLDAARRAVALAPAPPAATVIPSRLSPSGVRLLLAGYVPLPAQLPANDRLTNVVRVVDRDLTQPNEAISGTAAGLDELRGRIRQRGWLGSHVEAFTPSGTNQPVVAVVISLYSTAKGAADAVAADDSPQIAERIAAPIALGEQSAAYRGTWLSEGSLTLVWRRDRVVFGVTYRDPPDQARMEAVIATAQLLDNAYTLRTLSPPLFGRPPDLPRRSPAAGAAPRLERGKRATSALVAAGLAMLLALLLSVPALFLGRRRRHA